MNASSIGQVRSRAARGKLSPGTVMHATDLALYHYDSCPYCFRVRRALGKLGVEVELRNIYGDPRHMRDLIDARGIKTVPVLRIHRENGPDEWMGESRDIVAYLERRFGQQG